MFSSSDNNKAEMIKKKSVHIDAQSWMFINKHIFCCTAVLFLCLWKAACVHFNPKTALKLRSYDAILKIVKSTRGRYEITALSSTRRVECSTTF